MTIRTRIVAGLCAATLAGLLGQTLAAVAWFSGSGNRSISGRVTDQDGAPVAGVCVEGHEADGSNSPTVREYDPGWTYSPFAVASTATDGSYTLRRLVPIGYKLRFRECPSAPQRVPWSGTYYRIPGESKTAHPIAPEWWGDEPAYETADTVVVPAQADVTGINASVEKL